MTSPVLLAIDASQDTSSVAIQLFDAMSKSTNIYSKQLINTRQQGALLLPVIESLLDEHNINLKDIDALVVSNGPGRFTGLRVATSLVQGLAYGFDKKIICLNSLQLLAQQYADQVLIKDQIENKNKPIWVCIKAYNDVYYQDKFTLDNEVVQRGSQDHNGYIRSSQDMIIELKNEKEYNYIGTGWQDLISASNILKFQDIYTHQVDVKYAFKQANIEYQAGNLVTAFEVLPVYGVNPYSNK